ncbi:predicted protein, partial [Nematostella vectensis]
QPTLRKLTVEELDRITAEGEKAAQAFGQADQQVAPLLQFQVPRKADQQVAPQTKAQPEVEKPGLADQYTKDVPFKKQQVSSVVAANMNALSTPGIPVEGSLVKVITTEVISPSHFYVHVCDHKTQQDLHDLTTKMNAHYNTAPPSTHWQPHVDELCAASTKGTWSRCIVENVMPGRAAKVFFVDY